MAAPTNVRVESTSLTTATLRWTYAGSSGLSVYQSLDGSSYTLVTQDILPSATSYDVIGLDSAIKYWFKMSDDLGSTFSSVVTVWVQACSDASGQLSPVVMPRVDDTVSAESFNEMAERIEVGLNRFISPEGQPCTACISDGALVIDCINYEGCDSIDIVTTTDVNSISLPNCDDTTVDLNFIIPPNATVGIGGWPKGIGFTGDEAFTSPVSGGSSGGSIRERIIPGGINDNQNSGKSRPGTPGGSGERRGGGGRAATTGNGCTCTPGSNGELSIIVCNPDGSPNTTNSLNCSAVAKGAKAIACGGRGPYTWSRTGTVEMKGANQASPGSTASGATVTLSPPTNASPGTAGTAYTRRIESVGCGHTVGTTHACGSTWALFTCADAFDSCSTVLGGSVSGTFAFIDSTCSCGTHNGHALSGCSSATTVSCGTICASGAECACATANGATEDRRTAPMIAAGCTPCGLSGGNTVSVTDDLGTVTTIILGA